eukprot:9476581-Pyramimonas_sp.AAC.4
MVRESVLEMAAQVFIWFEAPLSSWPFKLLLKVDGRCPRMRDIGREFWYDHGCNKDRDISDKIQKSFGSFEEFNSSTTVDDVLKLWGASAKMTNMHVERLLSLIRSATPMKNPFLERLLGAGYLGDWLKDHINKHGFKDPRINTTDDLVKAGAPLIKGAKAKRKNKNKNIGGARPWMLKAAKRLKDDRQVGIKRTRQEMNDILRSEATTFAQLPDEERTEFEEVAASLKMNKVMRASAADDDVDSAADVLKRRVANAGLGICSWESPIAKEHIQAAMADGDVLPPRTDGQPRGPFAVSSPLRKVFSTASVVDDAGRLVWEKEWR